MLFYLIFMIDNVQSVTESLINTHRKIPLMLKYQKWDYLKDKISYDPFPERPINSSWSVSCCTAMKRT